MDMHDGDRGHDRASRDRRHERVGVPEPLVRHHHPVPAERSHSGLIRDAQAAVAPCVLGCRQEGANFVAQLQRADGSVIWPDYATGTTETLALLAAEQRYLVEEVGRGSVSGANYPDKAEERLRRWDARRGISG
jgi:hypothetical protein